MLSVGKIFWLIIILIAVWYLFKIIEKRKLNIDKSNQKKENVIENLQDFEGVNTGPAVRKISRELGIDLSNLIINESFRNTLCNR